MRNGLKKLLDDLGDLVYLLKFRGRAEAQRFCRESLRTLAYKRVEYIVFTRSLEEDLPIPDPTLPFVFRFLKNEDLSSQRDFFLPSERERFRTWLKHGRICLGVFDRSRLIGYTWLSGEVDPKIEGVRLRLGPGDVYFGDVLVSPAFRRQGIHTQAAIYRMHYAQKQGYQRAVGIVARKNTPAINVVIKIGFEETDRLFFRRFLWARSFRYQRGMF